MKAALVFTDLFALLLAKFLSKKSNRFLIVELEGYSVSAPIELYIKSVGGSVVSTKDFIKYRNSVKHVWVHSFGRASEARKIADHLKASYSLYSDGLKNELGRKAIDSFWSEYQSILFFGFVYNRDFIKKEMPIDVLTFNDIKSSFYFLRKELLVKSFCSERDLKKDWVFLRYWGQGKGEFVKGLTYPAMLNKYLSLNSSKDIILKGDSRVKSDIKSLPEKLVENSIDTTPIDDKFEVVNKRYDIELDKYFAELMLPEEIVGALHCFDSSLSVYAAAFTNAKIVFPDSDFINQVFNDKSFANSVINYSEMYRTVCDEITKRKMNNEFNGDDFFVLEKRLGLFNVCNDSFELEFVGENKLQEEKVNNSFFILNKKIKTEAGPPDILRDVAIAFEQSGDIDTAFKVMEKAHLLRPKGPLIKRKLDEYRQILAEQK